MVDLDAATSLHATIRDQRANQPLSILNLAEPILSEQGQPQSPSSSTLTSNAHNNSSSTSNTAPPSLLTPTTLTADLAHYRDLFSKLRFSYLEQVTKEKYLRSIVGDPPVLFTASDNLALEDRLTGMKSALKAQKEENDRLVTEMETLAARLAERHDFVTDRLGELDRLPAEIEAMRQQVQAVKAELKLREEENGDDDQDDNEDDRNEERMNMTLEATRAAAAEREADIADLQRQIEALRTTKMPAKIRECESVDRELAELELRRNEAARVAREVKLTRENGGRDVVEEKGRWYRGEDAVLRGLLGVN